jgi:hypothetical protein
VVGWPSGGECGGQERGGCRRLCWGLRCIGCCGEGVAQTAYRRLVGRQVRKPGRQWSQPGETAYPVATEHGNRRGDSAHGDRGQKDRHIVPPQRKQLLSNKI